LRRASRLRVVGRTFDHSSKNNPSKELRTSTRRLGEFRLQGDEITTGRMKHVPPYLVGRKKGGGAIPMAPRQADRAPSCACKSDRKSSIKKTSGRRCRFQGREKTSTTSTREKRRGFKNGSGETEKGEKENRKVCKMTERRVQRDSRRAGQQGHQKRRDRAAADTTRPQLGSALRTGRGIGIVAASSDGLTITCPIPKNKFPSQDWRDQRPPSQRVANGAPYSRRPGYSKSKTLYDRA